MHFLINLFTGENHETGNKQKEHRKTHRRTLRAYSAFSMLHRLRLRPGQTHVKTLSDKITESVKF